MVLVPGSPVSSEWLGVTQWASCSGRGVWANTSGEQSPVLQSWKLKRSEARLGRLGADGSIQGDQVCVDSCTGRCEALELT